MNESFLCKLIRFFGAIFCFLPASFNLILARALGYLGYCLMSKKRQVVEDNLRTVFKQKTLKEINQISLKVFENFASCFMDLLRLPIIKKEGYDKTVVLEGREHLEKALSLGKGCILLAIHSGSWELASLVGSLCNHPYNVVANEQKKAPLLNLLLNEYRKIAGAKVIPPGSSTRDIIRALQNNEIVSLVFDQGGKDGSVVDFLGKSASMSTGAIRMALKYGVPICPVWIERQEGFKHVLKMYPADILTSSDNENKDTMLYTQRYADFFAKRLQANPYEYMWFYKVFKYSNDRNVLIINDGKTGHLRQSQAVAETLNKALINKKKKMHLKTINVEFKTRWLAKLFSVYCCIAQFFRFLRKEETLKFFLKKGTYEQLIQIKPDYVISCGSQAARVSFILSRLKSIKSIHILKPNALSRKNFSLIISPEHDKGRKNVYSHVVYTKIALNLITPEYLSQQQEQLLLRYSHLKSNVRMKMGVLLGGNTKGVTYDVQQIRFLIKKIKEAALHYNFDILLTTSRRTPKGVDEMLVKELRHFERCPLLIIANEQNISEAVGGILALSDILIVSGESISMVSEAVSSGKKTIVFSPNASYDTDVNTKYDQFVLGLSHQRYVLASSIKDISLAINQVMSRKISSKSIDDQQTIIQAIEAL